MRRLEAVCLYKVIVVTNRGLFFFFSLFFFDDSHLSGYIDSSGHGFGMLKRRMNIGCIRRDRLWAP